MKTYLALVAVIWFLAYPGTMGLECAAAAQGVEPIARAFALASEPSETNAQVSASSNLRLTFGVDVWLNQWQTGFAVNDSGGRNIKNTTATAVGVGWVPNVTLGYRRFFVSASYLWTPDYHFGTTRDVVTTNVVTSANDVFVREIRSTASRQEVEVTFGYRVFDAEQGFIAVAAGYKGIFQDYLSEVRFAPAGQPANFSPFSPLPNTTNFNGGFAGVVGAASLGSGLGLFGNAAGGALVAHCHPACPRYAVAPYAAAKIGVSYRPLDLPLTFTAGYRVQVLNTESNAVTGRTGNVIDLLHGFVFGGHWTF